MKFDIIIGNPPYQDGSGSKSSQPGKKNLYQQFSLKAIELTKDGGFIGFVTPPGIFKTTDYTKKSECFEALSQYDILYINMDVNKFFDVGSLISYWVLQKTKNNILTTIKSQNLEDVYDISELNYIPSKVSQATLSILSKLKAGEINFNFIRDKKHGSDKVLGLTRLNHIHRSGKYQTHINSESDLNYDTKYAEELNSILSTKVYRWLNYAIRYDAVIYHNFLNGFTHPKLGNKDVWTDQEIYEYFDLTEEEIKLIEETIKD